MLQRARSIQNKVMAVTMATTAIALIVTAIAMALYESQRYRTAIVEDLVTQADILARASAPALAFEDARAATEDLAVLRARPNIRMAAFITPLGEVFASYVAPGIANADPASLAGHENVHIEGGEITVAQPVFENQQRLGTVYVQGHYELGERLARFMAIIAGVMVASLGVAFVVSIFLQAAITKPILAIASTAHQVMQKRDFSLRVQRTTNDETGYLVDVFNGMMAEVGRRAEALESSNQSLQSEMVERRAAEEALRAADRKKDEFLATLAHELRNPLAPLRNGLELMKTAGADPQLAAQTREVMERQLRQMVRLVDDLLDVSRISTGKLVLREEPAELQTVLRYATETVNPFLQAREQTLDFTMPARPLMVMADTTRLAQVFSNLLNNAAKFSERGGRIELNVAPEGDFVTVSVTDHGIGIDPAMLESIFGMFEQIDRSLERTQTGLGVGLTLAKRLVELHAGTLHVESEGLGKGSRFVVRLPILMTPASSATESTIVAAARPAAAHACRVLLVDDNRDFATTMASIIESSGHAVQVAHDGVQGLQVAESFVPDVAFLDIGMPKLNGYELARRLRALPALGHVYLVSITGWGQDADLQRGREAGFDLHLVKPVEPARILAILTEACGDPR
jgi:signal transduction histidine kinase/ActR/RegA family two-component response regulator